MPEPGAYVIAAIAAAVPAPFAVLLLAAHAVHALTTTIRNHRRSRPMTDNTAYVEVLARLLCAADAHVYDGDHPSWQELRVAQHGRGQDDYRKAARWLAARLTVTARPPVDRAAVLRDAADRIDRTDLPDDYVDLFDNGANWATAELRRMADEAQQQPDTEAHPPHHRWMVETRDSLANEWAPGMRFTDRAEAVARLQTATELYPEWRDGTPVQRRLVRETTTYTVEPAATRSAGPATDNGAGQ